jgi:hypothetical protein
MTANNERSNTYIENFALLGYRLVVTDVSEQAYSPISKVQAIQQDGNDNFPRNDGKQLPIYAA